MTDRPNDSVDDAVDQFLRHLEEGTTRPSLSGLTDDERHEAEAVLHLLEDFWGTDVPAASPLEDDPIAIELGLVPAQPTTVPIDGRVAKRLRMAQGLQLQQVADAMAQRGHLRALNSLLRME